MEDDPDLARAPDEEASPPADPLGEARRVLDSDRRDRELACNEEIQQVLAKYRCRIDVTPATVTLTAEA